MDARRQKTTQELAKTFLGLNTPAAQLITPQPSAGTYVSVQASRLPG
jgi:hypothetical protein